ncbi:MAG: ImmA/IrrE family metallo-endopeptidase [Clostridia bacterium]|nr:ImmA/IrrE family metallo-endopeptidase [Clostridia bacterium]
MNNILNKAYELYKKFDTCNPLRLCEYLGINLMYSDLPPVTDGIYFTVRDNQVILVNQNISREKARYVIAHELGHALLHPDQNYMFMANRTLMKTGRYEIEADYFCVSLLLCDILKNNQVDNMTSLELAKMAGLPEKSVSMWMKNTNVCELSKIYSKKEED